MAKKVKSAMATSTLVVGSVSGYMVAMPEFTQENVGNFVYNVVTKGDIESAEKDINDLGVNFDTAEPADMYKAGAYILRESVERAYKETQKANEEEIKKYCEQYGTYKGRDPDAETDVFLPIKSRKLYQNNANAPTLDISNTLATYNISLCDIPPSRIGFLADLKLKVFNKELYKNLYTYRSVLKYKEITKVVYVKEGGKVARDGKGRPKTKVIKYKEYWTESELDPFDDAVLLAMFFEKSPYYQLEKEIYNSKPENENGKAKDEKEWEKKKGEYEKKLKKLVEGVDGNLNKDKEMIEKRTEQLKMKYMADRYLKFIYGQPYYGSHREYVYKDNTTGTSDINSIFGSPVKKFFYTGDLMQKYVRNNYYDTITVSPESTKEEEGFFKRLNNWLTKRRDSRKKDYAKSEIKRRYMGKEGPKMDIDEDGNVIEKVRKASYQRQEKFKITDYKILNRTQINKFHEWKERDFTKDIGESDIKDKMKLGSLSNATKSESGGIKATYNDMKKKYPDAIKTHESLVKLLKKKKLYDKASVSHGQSSKNDDKVLGYGEGLKFIESKEEPLSLTDFVRKRTFETKYKLSKPAKDKKVGEEWKNKKEKFSDGGYTTFNYLKDEDLKKAIEKNKKDYEKLKEKLVKKDAEKAVQQGDGSGPSSATEESIVAECRKYLGRPYILGGNSLTNGIDCSGFTKAILAKYGVNLPRYSGDQHKCGRSVSLAQARPGDIVCYRGHVAIYIGNNRIIHASSPSTGIIETSINYGSRPIDIRRVLPDNAGPVTGGSTGGGTSSGGGTVQREKTLNSTAGTKAVTAEDLEKGLRGQLKGMGKTILKYSVKYNQDPAFMASIMITECGGNPTANHKNNPMSNLYNGYGKPATYPTMEAGIEAGIKNISKNPAYKNAKNIQEFARTYLGYGPASWISLTGSTYKKITGRDISTMKVNNGTDPSTSDGAGGSSDGSNGGLKYDPDIDGRGLTMDVAFPITDNFGDAKKGKISSDKVFVPLTVEQKITMCQTAMYNSVEPTDPSSINKKSNFDDTGYNFDKIDRRKYVYAKELEDVIWGSFRKEQAKFLFVFSYNKKKNIDGEGLDLDVENKVVTSGEVRGVGEGTTGGGNGAIVATAQKHLGEGPGAFWSFMGMPNNHWCCMFVSKIMDEAGIKPPTWVKTAATTSALANARKNNTFKPAGSYTPAPGDVIWFKFSSSGVNVQNETNHIGIVKSVEGSTVVTIEGNSGPGVAPSGTHVVENKHKLSAPYIVGYQSMGGSSSTESAPSSTQDGSGSSEASEKQGIENSDNANTSSSTGSSGSVRGSQYGGISHKNVTTAFTIEELLDNSGSSMHSLSGYLEGDDSDKIWRYLRSRGYSETSASVVIGSIIALGNAKFEKENNIKFKLNNGKDKEAEKKANKVYEDINKKGSKAKSKNKILIDNKVAEDLDKLKKKTNDILKSSKAHGIFNWKNERWKHDAYGLYDFSKRYGKNWDSLEAQIAFADWEMAHWSAKNFKQAPMIDYNEKNAMGLTDVSDKSTSTTEKQMKEKQINDKKIKSKYIDTRELVDSEGNFEQKRKKHLSDKVSWGGSYEEFKIFKYEKIDDASSVFVNCYIDPSGKSDSLVSSVIKNAEKVYSEYYSKREKNSDGKHKDYIAFRGSNHDIAKESYLLLGDNGGSGSDSSEDGNSIMEFKGAICSGFSDKVSSLGPITEHNVVASHNMPLGTIVFIPELKGKLGGGTFRDSKGKTYDLGPRGNGKFIVADNGGPYFDFDIHGYQGKKNMDVKVVSWGTGAVTWSVSYAYKDAQRRTFHANAWNQCFTKYGGFKTIKLTKFKKEDANNPLFNRN